MRHCGEHTLDIFSTKVQSRPQLGGQKIQIERERERESMKKRKKSV
jgi:hypothetical protein